MANNMQDKLVEYDTYSNTFLRTFNVRFAGPEGVYEIPIKARCWKDAESKLAAIKSNGVVHSELIAYDDN